MVNWLQKGLVIPLLPLFPSSLDPLQCDIDRSECHTTMIPGLTMLESSWPQVYA